MKKRNTCVHLFTLLLTLVLTMNLNAQVTIGSGEAPDKDALLDLKQKNDKSSTKGLLLPRVALVSTSSGNPLSAHVEGMTVYNTATVGDVTPGYYYNDGTKWIKLATSETTTGSEAPSFFYMPSFLLPTDTSDPRYNSTTKIFTIDLYQIYEEQFKLSDAGTSVKSPTAATLPVIVKDKLEYFITYYDNAVFQGVAVTDEAVLTYKLAPSYVITEETFMNIIFKGK